MMVRSLYYVRNTLAYWMLLTIRLVIKLSMLCEELLEGRLEVQRAWVMGGMDGSTKGCGDH